MKNIVIKGDISNETLNNIEALLKPPINEQHIVHINSQGGDISRAIDISVLLLRFGNSMIGFGHEFVASSALLIHQSCLGDRIATPTTRFLLHNVIFPHGHEITIQNLKDEFTIFSFYAKMTGRTIDQVYKLAAQRKYINATEALEFGFITKIIEHPFPTF